MSTWQHILIGRTRVQHKQRQEKRHNQRRSLRLERLENRRLMASDAFDEVVPVGSVSGETDVAVVEAASARSDNQGADLTIDIGDHVLQPNKPGQVISVYLSGTQRVQGIVFNIQLADGHPDVPGSRIDGPNITGVDLVGPGTVFGSAANTGHNFVETREQIWVVGTSTSNGTVAADGVLAYVTIDTTGWCGEDGPWELKLTGTFNGDTSFQGPSGRIVASVANGSIEIKRWHNSENAADVNCDGVATPLDALQVVNALNAHGSSDVLTIPEESLAALPCIDTNNDGMLTPADALQVINELNRPAISQSQPAGEGETLPWHNKSDPCDVNSDGSVTPLDLLILFNDINENGKRELNAELGEPPQVAVDVSGDNRVTPLDVLHVINHLAAQNDGEQGPSGFGEFDIEWLVEEETPASDALESALTDIAEEVSLAGLV